MMTTTPYALRRLTGVALTLLALTSTTAVAHADEPTGIASRFADVGETSPHAPAVASLAATGIVQGCGPDQFCPNDQLQRAQLATLLTRTLDLPPAPSAGFRDVHAGSPHAAGIDAAAAAGVTTGCARGRFCPSLSVTRGQVASFLARALELQPTGRHRFVDTGRNVHATAIRALADAGITQGCGRDRFCPDAAVTRAQFASLLYQAGQHGHLPTTAAPDHGQPPRSPAPAPAPAPSPGPTAPPSPPSAPEPSPQPPTDPERPGAQRRGLHFTPEEVVIWRERAERGPYRVSGDASPNSPGDWERIVANTRRFAERPGDGRWRGPTQGDLRTCVRQGDGEPPLTGLAGLRDAAFHALVTGERTHVEAIRTELLWQVGQAGTDFSNGDRWCAGVLIDVNPSFAITNWLTKLLFAYDYLGPEPFTAAERRAIDAWFVDAAEFFQQDLDQALAGNFVDRVAGDRRLSATRANHPFCTETSFLGGPDNCAVHRFYNNRRAEIARFVGLVGVHQDQPSLRWSARSFVEELLAFGVFPQGHMGDFERWTSDNPDLGWAYSVNTLASALTIADAFARAGDPSLYRFATSDGAVGSQGGTKTLQWTARAMAGYLDGTHERYGTDDPSRAGDVRYLIDGLNDATGWYSVHDVGMAPANVYFRDTYLAGVHTRTGAGTARYPARAASNGPHEAWTGPGGVFPGLLFMHGQLEGQVWPY